MNKLLILLAFALCAYGQTGLGKSTITASGPCLDVDGDGYGVGPGCLGPDADDTDATVYSPAQVISKYGSINAFLVHLGYQSSTTPAPVYCISPAGSDTTGATSTNADTACATPFQTWHGVYIHFEPAGVPAIILFRGGTYTQQVMPNVGGTPSQSVVVMGYPGEAAIIDYSASTGGAVVTAPYPYVTISNLRIKGNRSGAGYSGGTYILYQSGSQNITFIGDVLQYCEISGAGTDSNVDADNTINFTVQYNVVHDPATSGQHNIYLGSNTVPTTNAVVRDNILYSVHTGNYPNLQFNGRCNGCYFESNMLYDSDGQEIAFLNGVSNSFLRNNLVFNTGVAGGRTLSFTLTNGNNTTQCQVVGVPSICSWDQTNNVIENNTFWAGTNAMDGSGPVSDTTVEIINNQLTQGICGNGSAPPCGNLGGNFYRNNIIVSGGVVVPTSNSGYPPVSYANANLNYWASDTWTDNIFNNQNGSPYVVGLGPGGGYGYYPYTCAAFAGQALSSTGCSTASPSFTNVNTGLWNTPSAFNFTPATSSAVIGAGTGTASLGSDIYGNIRRSPPSIGAIEPAGGAVSISASATLVTALSCAPLGIASGTPTTCTVTLAQAAGAAGVVVTVASNSQLLTLPATVSVAANATTATFTATAGTITSGQTVVVTASLNGSSQTASVALTAPAPASQVSSVSCTPSSLASGAAATCTVTLTQAAATGGSTVTLASGTATLTVPASVLVAAGSSSATFSATAGTIATAQSAVVTATLNGASSTASIALTASVVTSQASAWQQLANTTLQSACPANNFGGINYAFSSYCPYVINAWGSAMADTKRNRLIIWGGGHGDYQGNEVYALNLTATPPSMTRLTDPSAWNYSASYEVDPDGNPTSRHTYSDLVYLPVQDALFSFSGAVPSGNGTNHTWIFTFADNTWHAKDPVNPVGFDPTSISVSVTGAACAYDPNTQTVFCLDGNTQYLLQYFPTTNTYKRLSISANYALSASPAIDPVRKYMILMGTLGTAFKVQAIDISGADPTYAVQDWTSQVTGCAAMGVNWPGLTFDSALGKLVGYPNQGNTVYVFDTGTKTCTAQSLNNGPQTAASSTGTFGRFQYFPSLNTFALVNAADQNAYTVQLASTSASASACDLNADGVVNSLDVGIAINQALGVTACTTAALGGNGQCGAVDVQRVIIASLGGACLTGQ